MTKAYRLVWTDDNVIRLEMRPAPDNTETNSGLPCADFDTEEDMDNFITTNNLRRLAQEEE